MPPQPRSEARKQLLELGYYMGERQRIVRDALASGMTLRQIAAESGLGYSTVFRWKKKWEEGGSCR